MSQAVGRFGTDKVGETRIGGASPQALAQRGLMRRVEAGETAGGGGCGSACKECSVHVHGHGLWVVQGSHCPLQSRAGAGELR